MAGDSENCSAGRVPAGRGLLVALLVAMPLYIFGTFGHDLWRPAEAREAGIAREMIESGNWVATYLNGHLFLEKPPLYTWAIALPLKWLGYRDWVVRLPVFLFTLGTLLTVFALARRRLGVVGAQWALISLASMVLFMEVNHGAMIDNGLVFFIALAMLAFWRMDERAGQFWLWSGLFYISLGLAFLCKGAIGPLLILAAAAGFTISNRRWALLRSWHPALGLGILALLVGGWLWALWLKGGADYFRVFFIDNHWHRFLGKEGPTQDFFYYLPLIFGATAPWVLVVPLGCWAAWRQWREAGPGARRFWNYLGWWVGAMLVLLSVSRGKDNQYLLPLLPPLAVLCGAWVERSLAEGPIPRWAMALMGLFAVALVLGAVLAPLAPILYFGKLFPGCLLWSVGLGAVGAWTLRGLWFRRWRAIWTGLAILLVGLGFAGGLFLERVLNDDKSTKPLVAVIRECLPPGATLWGYDLNENTEGCLIFYGLRPRRVLGGEDAARLGRQPEPALILLSSRNQRNEFRDQILAMRYWRVVREVQVGGRYYWLMGNESVKITGP